MDESESNMPTYPYFTAGDVTILADGTRVYSMYANGYAPLSGGGAYRDKGILVGRAWQTGNGWVASPPRRDGRPDSWLDEVTRAMRGFKTRREAAVYLYGVSDGAWL